MPKELVMAIGLPFSGKSTLGKEYGAKGYQIIERDALLEEITRSTVFREELIRACDDNGIDAADHRKTFPHRNEIALRMLSDKIRGIVTESEEAKFFYDGTNLQKKARAGVLQLRDEGVKVIGIYLDIPLKEIRRRMETALSTDERRGQFNEASFRSLEHMIKMFEEPKIDEGFDELGVIKNEADEKDRELGLSLK